jgi:hypothetical protein
MKNTDTHKVVLPTGDISGKATAAGFCPNNESSDKDTN